MARVRIREVEGGPELRVRLPLAEHVAIDGDRSHALVQLQQDPPVVPADEVLLAGVADRLPVGVAAAHPHLVVGEQVEGVADRLRVDVRAGAHDHGATGSQPGHRTVPRPLRPHLRPQRHRDLRQHLQPVQVHDVVVVGAAHVLRPERPDLVAGRRGRARVAGGQVGQLGADRVGSGAHQGDGGLVRRGLEVRSQRRHQLGLHRHVDGIPVLRNGLLLHRAAARDHVPEPGRLGGRVDLHGRDLADRGVVLQLRIQRAPVEGVALGLDGGPVERDLAAAHIGCGGAGIIGPDLVDTGHGQRVRRRRGGTHEPRKERSDEHRDPLEIHRKTPSVAADPRPHREIGRDPSCSSPCRTILASPNDVTHPPSGGHRLPAYGCSQRAGNGQPAGSNARSQLANRGCAVMPTRSYSRLAPVLDSLSTTSCAPSFPSS